MERIRKFIRVSGYVQCVGFRYFGCQNAARLGLTGWVRNCADGSVELEVQGDVVAVASFLDAVARGPRYAQVDDLAVRPLDLVDFERSFEAKDV